MFSWVRKRFSRKLAFFLTLTLIPLMALTGFFLTRALERQWIDELTQSLLTQAHLITSQLPSSSFSEPPKTTKLQDIAIELGQSCHCRLTFIREDGTVLGDSYLTRKEMIQVENHRSRPEIQAALYAREGSSIRYSQTIQEDLLYAAVPFSSNGGTLGVVRISLPLTRVRVKIDRIRKTIYFVIAIILILTLVAIWITSRSISRPVGEMLDVAQRFSQGDYDVRLLDFPPDELGKLGKTLNVLAKRVRSTIHELTQEKAQLSTILSNMVEAVVAVDASGSIIAFNPALSDLLSVNREKAIGKPILEVLRNSELESLITQTLSDGVTRVEEVQILSPEQRRFEATVVPLSGEKEKVGALLVLHEITRIRKLEQVRKDFVANVSHELRTPLAAIKGYAETLRAGGVDDKKNREEFVATIERHADRMTRLVEDLLELSALESGSRKLKRESVSLVEMASEVGKSLHPLGRKKNVTVTVADPKDLPDVSVDPIQMRQVLTNLIENAIKFNNSDGSVTVTFEREKDSVKVSVRDTGQGIPSHHVPRLFERFYRVDKARSREMGGTGLGLAITKHIVEAHGGRIAAESEEGRGSTFWFQIPLS